jgi:predicted acyl esterase
VAELPDPGHDRPSWYLGPSGSLADAPPAQAGADSFTWNAHARPLTNFTGDTAAGSGGLWTATPPYQWSQNPPGSAASYVTGPLSANTTVVGAGAVKAWVKSSTPNVDLQATISEVRPDGKETFVQGGWVRGNERKLDAAKSTPLEPVLSLRAADVAPMPANKYVEVTIPLYYQGHAYRAGSRIRVTVTGPQRRPADLGVRRDRPDRHRQRLDRPLEGDAVEPAAAGRPRRERPSGLPPCPGLRGEPCRDYQPYTNR